MQPAFEHLVAVLRHEAFVGNAKDLPTTYMLVPATIFLARQGGSFPSEQLKRRFIRWIYLAGLWARYSGATETKLQQDVALVAGSDPDPTPELEAAILRERGRLVIEASDLVEAGVRSTAAPLAQIVAHARGSRDWFTGIRIYDKAVGRSEVSDRHHVFSLAVLKRAGFDPNRDRKANNELANRVFLTQKAPKEIRSSEPAQYLPEVDEDQPGVLRAQSIPMDRELWHPENYHDFLTHRRNLLARAINDFIASWIPRMEEGVVDEHGVREMMAAGEGETVEFKSSLRWDRREERANKQLEKVVTKTLAAFLNSRGGTLLVGVDDSGAAVGIDGDYATLRKRDRDGFQLHLQQLIERDLGAASATYLTTTFHEIDGADICQVTVEPSDEPVYVEDRRVAIFFLRTGNATRSLSVKDAVKYIQRRWGRAA